MQKLNSERGMSLIEATIILMVLAILTSVLAPSMGDYVNDARQVKVKEDVEVIGLSVARLLKDIGHPFPLVNPALAPATRYNKANRVDILVGPGNSPSINTVTYPDFNGGTETATASLNWDDAIDNDVVDDLEDHMVTNSISYTPPILPPPAGSGGPRFGIGWRGGYLSGLSSDPWGFRYAVNSVFLGTAADSTDKGWAMDVVAYSSGSNGTVDTRFDRVGLVPGVDDVVYTIQGHTR